MPVLSEEGDQMIKSTTYMIIIGVLAVALAGTVAYIALNNDGPNNTSVPDDDKGDDPPQEIFYVILAESKYEPYVTSENQRFVKPGDRHTVDVFVIPGFSYLGLYDEQGNLLTKAKSYTFTPERSMNIEIRASLIRDASFKVTATPKVAIGTVAEFILKVEPNYNVYIADRNYTFRYGPTDPNPTFYESTSHITIVIQEPALQGLEITYWVKYLDGTTAQSTWKYSG
jgi:hypothetical protein